MELYEELVNKLETEDFSLELINYCKDMFNGMLSNDDFKNFSKLFYKKAQESCPVLTDEQIGQILNAIYWGGGIRLEDVLFIDGGAFSSSGYWNTWGDGEYKSASSMNFYGPSKKYKEIDFLDTTHFFRYNLFVSKKLNESIVPILPQLRDEINDIFVNYYHNDSFPEELTSDRTFLCYYAISRDENEIFDGLNNKTPFNVSIICRVENECKVIKLDINCNLNNEKFLTVTNVDENFERLSTIIAQSKHSDKSNDKRIRLE